jgi:hypothetical protein
MLAPAKPDSRSSQAESEQAAPARHAARHVRGPLEGPGQRRSSKRCRASSAMQFHQASPCKDALGRAHRSETASKRAMEIGAWVHVSSIHSAGECPGSSQRSPRWVAQGGLQTEFSRLKQTLEGVCRSELSCREPGASFACCQ